MQPFHDEEPAQWRFLLASTLDCISAKDSARLKHEPSSGTPKNRGQGPGAISIHKLVTPERCAREHRVKSSGHSQLIAFSSCSIRQVERRKPDCPRAHQRNFKAEPAWAWRGILSSPVREKKIANWRAFREGLKEPQANFSALQTVWRRGRDSLSAIPSKSW